MNTGQNITGLILAGGAGRRVDGRDKGLLAWRGRPLIEHVLEKLTPQVSSILISCNRNQDRYGRYRHRLVGDSRPDFQGPLAGLEAARADIATEFTLICPCDTPLLPADLAVRLLQGFASPAGRSLDISYASDGERGQYLCALIRTACLDTISDYLDQGGRSVRGWYQLQATLQVDFADCPDAFSNFNHLDQAAMSQQ
jgi:molybdopterin-guanine dinucleotide biosynthesis protein A